MSVKDVLQFNNNKHVLKRITIALVYQREQFLEDF